MGASFNSRTSGLHPEDGGANPSAPTNNSVVSSSRCGGSQSHSPHRYASPVWAVSRQRDGGAKIGVGDGAVWCELKAPFAAAVYYPRSFTSLGSCPFKAEKPGRHRHGGPFALPGGPGTWSTKPGCEVRLLGGAPFHGLRAGTRAGLLWYHGLVAQWTRAAGFYPAG